MFSIVVPELIILLIIIVLLFGPDHIGKRIHSFRESLRGKNQATVRHEPPIKQKNKTD